VQTERVALHEAARQRYELPHSFALALRLILMFGVTFANSAAAAEPSAQRVAQLTYMVRQDCGSCHGMTLGGGLGPALLPAALKDKPAAYIKHVILYGNKDTAMPGWSPLLSDADAEWITARLLAGFPDAR
jgi:cytochrome c55X